MATPEFVQLVEKLKKTHKELEGHRVMWNPKNHRIVVQFSSGLWGICQQQSLDLLANVRSRSDLKVAKYWAIRTEKTAPLFNIMERAFPKRKRG